MIRARRGHFDPLLAGPTAHGGPIRLQVWERQADKLVRTYAGEGPTFSTSLGAHLVVVDGGRKLRIADDAAIPINGCDRARFAQGAVLVVRHHDDEVADRCRRLPQRPGHVGVREVRADFQLRGERCLHPLKERDHERIVGVVEILEVDVDPLKPVLEQPAAKSKDHRVLFCRIGQQKVRALRIEVAHFRIAEDRHDVQVVLASDRQDFIVVRHHRRIPVMEVEALAVVVEMHPRRKQMRHPSRVFTKRVETGFLPRRVERRHDIVRLDWRTRGVGGLLSIQLSETR